MTVLGASDSSWKAGDMVQFTESVTVDTTGGKPDIGLTAGTQTVRAPYAGGWGTDLLNFAWPSNGGTIRNASGTDTDLGHVGATSPTPAPNRTQEPAEEEPAGTETVLTAQFDQKPPSHDGTTQFVVRFSFSADITRGFRKLRDRGFEMVDAATDLITPLRYFSWVSWSVADLRSTIRQANCHSGDFLNGPARVNRRPDPPVNRQSNFALFRARVIERSAGHQAISCQSPDRTTSDL